MKTSVDVSYRPLDVDAAPQRFGVAPAQGGRFTEPKSCPSQAADFEIVVEPLVETFEARFASWQLRAEEQAARRLDLSGVIDVRGHDQPPPG